MLFFRFSSLRTGKFVVEYKIDIYQEVFGVYCLRCGKDAPEKQVFCDSCLLIMDAYPVKPGTPIQLPARKKPAELKKQASRKKVLPQSEQLARARTLNRWLIVLIVLLSLALCAAGVMLLK